MTKMAILCLALAIYHESRGEPENGQYAVAEVVVNRSIERNKTICEVIYEPRQFSGSNRWKVPKENKQWERSIFIATNVLDNGVSTNYTNGSKYFRIASLSPKNKQIIHIGNHVFYK